MIALAVTEFAGLTHLIPTRQAATDPIKTPSGPTSIAIAQRVPPALAVAPFDATQARKHQEAWAKYIGVPVEYTNSIGMKFRLIPPGEFTMGTSSEEAAEIASHVQEDWVKAAVLSEVPARKVRIAEPFYLGTTEVTVGQFKQFVAATKYRTHAETNGNGGEAFTGEKIESRPEFTWRHPNLTRSDCTPVGQLCPDDANAFCTWLQGLEGRTCQLPDEERWEYACRAGTVTPYSLGSEAETRKLHELAGSKLQSGVHAVALGPVNPFGLFDVHGNYDEMCRCKDGRYINRGGHGFYDATMIRSAFRPAPIKHLRSYETQSFRVAIVGNLRPATAAPTPGSEAKQGPLPTPFTDTDRRVAAFVLSVGGIVGVDGQDQEIKAAADLPRKPFRLTTVGLYNEQVTDAGLVHFEGCKNLKALRLQGTQVTDSGLVHFKGCAILTKLELLDTPATDAGLAHFKDHKNLAHLALSSPTFTDAGLVHFGGCKSLRRLYLHNTQVTDTGLTSVLKGCETLEWLNLEGCKQITGATLAHLGAFKHLTELYLHSTNVKDADLANLNGCKNLFRLVLDDTALTDAGLAHLAALDGLTELYIRTTKVTAEGVEDLAKALPKLRIAWDQGTIGPPLTVAPFTDADVQRIAALPAAEQIEEVRKELMRRNHGFDGKVEHKIEDGVVTEIRIVTDKVTDISPIRVFNALRVLDCSGTYTDWRATGNWPT